MLDVTIVIVALPSIAADLGGDLRTVQWVVDVYALMLAALLLNMGAVADRVGQRRIFLTGLGIFGAASVGCGLAGTSGVLIAARAVQGLGGAMLFATGLAVLGTEYQGAARAKALGIFGAVFGGAVAVGPLAGGLVLEVADWRWIFLVNVPVVLVAFIVAAGHVEESRDARPRPIDWAGQVTFTLGVAGLVAALIQGGRWGWESGRTVGLLVAATGSLGAFVVVESRQDQPMFELSMLRQRSFAGASIAAFATSASLFGMFVYLTLWFQRVEGLDGLEAGLRLLPVTVLALVAAAAAGRLSGVVSPRWVLTLALSCTAAGLLQMTALDAGSAWTVALPGLVLCGLGFGLANPTVAAVTLAVADPARLATATGMNSTFRQVGVATGVAAQGAIFDHALRPPTGISAGAAVTAPSAELVERYATALDHVFVAGSLIAGVGAVLAAMLVRATVPQAASNPPAGPAAIDRTEPASG
jgi:EmrB/QacA subfamily drug resistance transporter